MRAFSLLGLTAIWSVLLAPQVRATDKAFAHPMVEQYLIKGNLGEGHKALTRHLSDHPEDSQARFGLGTLEFLRGVERFAQSLHRYGLRTDAPEVPFLRLSIPANKNPEPITYKKFRSVFEKLIADLNQAEKTLAQVKDEDVKLKLRIGLFRLDLDGNGRAEQKETFWRIFTSVALRAAKIDLNERQKSFPIGFDRADVHWMRGYSHLIRAMAEAYLAYNSEDFFNYTAHVFFRGANSPYTKILYKKKEDTGFDEDRIADLIAAIHLVRFKPTEPKRMEKAHEHMLQMVQQSRQCWKYALKETDNDREWIPNAKQTSLLPGMRVTEEMIQDWKHFLDEFEALFRGKKLIPHWRLKESHGINLKAVFYKPRTFDLVMWVHGAAALPYLEKGPRTDQRTWNRLQRTFGGNFLAFAVWFQ